MKNILRYYISLDTTTNIRKILVENPLNIMSLNAKTQNLEVVTIQKKEHVLTSLPTGEDILKRL